MLSRNEQTGTFLRTRQPWTPERWDDGYVNKGRFKVYRPDCPRAFRDGYALRSQVVWWLAKGEPHPRDRELHHKNENKLDDSLENLESLENADHQREHARLDGSRVWFDCAKCGKRFDMPKHRVRYTRAFCSQACWNQRGKL